MFDPGDISRDMRGRCSTDELVALVAGEQWGMVARRQLIELEVGPDAIDRRITDRRLHVWFPGVYSAGHRAVSLRGRLMAAVLASRAVADLGGGTAAGLWELRSGYPARTVVFAPTAKRELPPLRRRRIVLPDDERDERHGIPVTTVSRTLLDLAAELDVHALSRAVEEAEKRRYADVTPVGVLVARYPYAPGRAKLLRILGEDLSSRNATRRELEARMLALVEQSEMLRPLINTMVAGFEVDMVWPSARLVVELDSREQHTTGAAFDRDRAKWRALGVAGWLVVPVTWRHVTIEAQALIADLERLQASRTALHEPRQTRQM